MSVRGEFRRILGELLTALRDGEVDPGTVAELEPLLERAVDDLSAAAEAALPLLARLDAARLSDPGEHRRFVDIRDRLEAVSRIILGRPASASSAPPARGPRERSGS